MIEEVVMSDTSTNMTNKQKIDQLIYQGARERMLGELEDVLKENSTHLQLAIQTGHATAITSRLAEFRKVVDYMEAIADKIIEFDRLDGGEE